MTLSTNERCSECPSKVRILLPGIGLTRILKTTPPSKNPRLTGIALRFSVLETT